jgi:SAM-dependent methyltransferase
MSESSQLSPSQSPVSDARLTREAKAYDEGQVWEINNRWTRRVLHVIYGPNTARGERRFRQLLGERAKDRRAMDVGCGTGALSGELHAMGAHSVHGFDVSKREIEQARLEYGDLQGVTFDVCGAEESIEGQFDVIAGRSVLHHLDFRNVLPDLFERNLAPGGRMVFMEPMSHPMTLAFHRFVPSAHTPDEWPLTPQDVSWLKQRFAAHVIPINLTSFPAGVLSSFLFSSPDNRMLRLADSIDQSLERHRRFISRGRQGIIVIDRPTARSPQANARP